jgi:hypothetical protein
LCSVVKEVGLSDDSNCSLAIFVELLRLLYNRLIGYIITSLYDRKDDRSRVSDIRINKGMNGINVFVVLLIVRYLDYP